MSTVLDTLRTMRTAADVQTLKRLHEKGWLNMTEVERAFYRADLWGAYNASDLNRVGEAVEYVADRLNEIGGFDLRVTAKQDWTDEDIQTQEQMDAYLADIAAIRAAYDTLPAAPDDMENLTFSEANDIEKILLAAEDALQRVMKSFIYSGTVNSGMIWEEFT